VSSLRTSGPQCARDTEHQLAYDPPARIIAPVGAGQPAISSSRRPRNRAHSPVDASAESAGG
jgi:hypothetical protein